MAPGTDSRMLSLWVKVSRQYFTRGVVKDPSPAFLLLCNSKCVSISLQPNSKAFGCSDLTLLLLCLANKSIIVSLKKMTAFFSFSLRFVSDSFLSS